MERDQTWQEQLDAFMQSDLAASVVRPGSEVTFARQVENFLEELPAAEQGAEQPWLGAEVSVFLEDERQAGRLQERDESAVEDVYAAVYGMALSRLEAQTVEHGGEGTGERSVEEQTLTPTHEAHVITERVQTVLQEIENFARDRDGHGRSNDLER
jgi:hypothetical protein